MLKQNYLEQFRLLNGGLTGDNTTCCTRAKRVFLQDYVYTIFLMKESGRLLPIFWNVHKVRLYDHGKMAHTNVSLSSSIGFTRKWPLFPLNWSISRNRASNISLAYTDIVTYAKTGPERGPMHSFHHLRSYTHSWRQFQISILIRHSYYSDIKVSQKWWVVG